MRPSAEEITRRFQADIDRSIAQTGIHIQPILPSDENPPYVYTVGMTLIGAPELIVFGLPPQVAASMIHKMFAEMRMGNRPKNQKDIIDLASVPLRLENVSRSAVDEFTGQGDAYLVSHGHRPKYQQLMWPDEQGIFPNEKGFDERYRATQPYLGKKTMSIENESLLSSPSKH